MGHHVVTPPVGIVLIAGSELDEHRRNDRRASDGGKSHTNASTVNASLRPLESEVLHPRVHRRATPKSRREMFGNALLVLLNVLVLVLVLVPGAAVRLPRL